MPAANIKGFHRGGPKLLICHLESAKYKPDVLNTNWLSCVSLFMVLQEKVRICPFLSLCLQYEAALHCLNKVKHQSFENGRDGYV